MSEERSMHSWMVAWEDHMHELGFPKARIWTYISIEDNGITYSWTEDQDDIVDALEEFRLAMDVPAVQDVYDEQDAARHQASEEEHAASHASDSGWWEAGMRAFANVYHLMPDAVIRPPIMHDWDKVEE